MPQNHSDNNKRIVKNTFFLYGRMLFSMLVSLYTARAILNALGVEDFGIYNVAGGFVGMLSFLNASMSGATSRFLTFELGKDDRDKLHHTFASSVIIHFFIALFVVLICETIGLWYVNNKLVVPADSMQDVNWLYQFAIIGTFLSIIQTPFSAVIMSHEKMDIYAYFDIFGVLLKLGLVFFLQFYMGDRLFLWGLLIFLHSLLMVGIYFVYCVTHYRETHFKFVWKPDILKPMLSFSGWDLYGNLSVLIRTQGVNLLLNLFLGPIVNAATAIATQVQGAIMGFGSNLISAIRPQLIKQYAVGDYTYMFKLLSGGMKMTCLLLSVLTIPLLIELEYILHLWLGIVPEYTINICRLTLIFNFFAGISILLAAIIHAIGRMKRISFINGTIYLMVLPITYIIFKFGEVKPWIPYLINIIGISIGVLSNLWTIKLYIPSFDFKDFLWKDYILSLLLFFGAWIICWPLSLVLPQGLGRLVIITLTTTILLCFIGYFYYIPESIRIRIKGFINKKLKYRKVFI